MDRKSKSNEWYLDMQKADIPYTIWQHLLMILNIIFTKDNICSAIIPKHILSLDIIYLVYFAIYNCFI